MIEEERIEELKQKLAIAKEALGFYADNDNWDLDHMTPTCWDDGAVDCGNRAKEALEKLK